MYKRYERQNDAVPDFFCVLQPSNMELGEKFCILQPPSLLIDAKSLSLIQGHKISKYNPFDENSFKKAKSRPKVGRLYQYVFIYRFYCKSKRWMETSTVYRFYLVEFISS